MESATAGKIPEEAHLLLQEVRWGGGIHGVNKNKRRGYKVRLDRGSAAASQFPKPDGSEVVGSAAGRGWQRGKKIPAESKNGHAC